MYLTNGGKNLSHKKMQYNCSEKRFDQRNQSIWITSIQISGVLSYLSICITDHTSNM